MDFGWNNSTDNLLSDKFAIYSLLQSSHFAAALESVIPAAALLGVGKMSYSINGRWYGLATPIRTSQSGNSQNVVPSMSAASWPLNTPCIWLRLQASTTKNEHVGKKCHTAGLWSRSPTANIIQIVGSWYGHHQTDRYIRAAVESGN